MRSLSNLLKFHMVHCDNNKKIIDYNNIIAEKLEEYNRKQEKTEVLQEDGFVAGLEYTEIEVADEESLQPAPEELVEEARFEAEKILEAAKQQAETIRRNAYDEGKIAGYEEAKMKALAEMNEQKVLLQKQEQKLIKHYKELEKNMEVTLVSALTDVFEGVFNIYFSDKQDMILYLLESALGNITIGNDFIIRVSKIDYPKMKEKKETLKELITKNANLEVIEDITLTKNQCLIETDMGVFDCSLDVQLDNLKKAILTLSMNQ